LAEPADWHLPALAGMLFADRIGDRRARCSSPCCSSWRRCSPLPIWGNQDRGIEAIGAWQAAIIGIAQARRWRPVSPRRRDYVAAASWPDPQPARYVFLLSVPVTAGASVFSSATCQGGACGRSCSWWNPDIRRRAAGHRRAPAPPAHCNLDVFVTYRFILGAIVLLIACWASATTSHAVAVFCWWKQRQPRGGTWATLTTLPSGKIEAVAPAEAGLSRARQATGTPITAALEGGAQWGKSPGSLATVDRSAAMQRRSIRPDRSGGRSFLLTSARPRHCAGAWPAGLRRTAADLCCWYFVAGGVACPAPGFGTATARLARRAGQRVHRRRLASGAAAGDLA
jgi:hypothetical protein